MRLRALDLVERVRGRDQHLFRHAAAVRAGAAEQIRLDHRDLESRLPRRHGDTHPGIPAAEDHDIEAACWHLLGPPRERIATRWQVQVWRASPSPLTRVGSCFTTGGMPWPKGQNGSS